ncbi:protein phosphatase CheZ [Thaumasiovibrio subtropicus]|uniref:protein phosphatase CheZ n=1 Tax=Thaumasiovibrio subtropicus TaxID=1891207 RepID=UPI000B3514F9|nr:protein phosphatase CheZ [Thaumasiovibrio subtropicus]
MVSLDQAKELVTLLEDGRQEEADALVGQWVHDTRQPIFEEVGKLTRQLHDSLTNFQLDPRISDLATSEIPDARDRLTYVIEKTEVAANKTMDAVEETFPIADRLVDHLQQVRPEWDKLMGGRIELNEFKALCHTIDQLLQQVEQDGGELRTQLTDILMAQDFQDLTGQVIRRVIDLVKEVEEQLVEILRAFGLDEAQAQAVISPTEQKKATTAPEGPIIDSSQRDDVVESQDDVDDLLSSLGF